jgi:hypothetical protein
LLLALQNSASPMAMLEHQPQGYCTEYGQPGLDRGRGRRGVEDLVRGRQRGELGDPRGFRIYLMRP